MEYLLQFATVALIHLLAVISPGPDFAMITHTSLTRSRRSAVWAAAGLGLGILVHVTYSLLGIGFVISQSILLFSTIKLLGAGYLIYIGSKAIRAKKQTAMSPTAAASRENDMTSFQALRLGFLTNVLNPKATIFFVSVFAQVINPETPSSWKLLYGAEMSLVTFLWFAIVALIFSHSFLKEKIRSIQHIIERITGAVLILFGLKLAFARAK